MSDPEKKRKKGRRWLIVGIVLLLLCAIVAIATRGGDDDDGTQVATVESAPVTPVLTSEPVATLTGEAAVLAVVTEVLGESNRDVPRIDDVSYVPWDDPDPDVITVQFALNDLFTPDQIRRNGLNDIVKVSRALIEAGFVDTDMNFIGSFVLTDVYGKKTEERVLQVTLPAEALAKINWTGFDPENIAVIGEHYYEHPAFAE